MKQARSWCGNVSTIMNNNNKKYKEKNNNMNDLNIVNIKSVVL